MATLVKTPSGKWKAIIRRAGWPLTVKTFRTQRDAGDWARRTEDDMVRGAFIQRAAGDRMTVAAAMKRYLADVVPSKRPTTQAADLRRSKIIVKHLGRYSLTSLTPEVIAQFRDMRLAGEDRKNAAGNPQPRTNSTVRLDLALLGHLLTIAIKEWGVNLPANPVTNIRRPVSGPGRNLIVNDLIDRAKVLQGGGGERLELNLVVKVEAAAQASLDRLFPSFKDADDSRWASVINRAKNGDEAALSAVDWTDAPEKHPVCAAVLSEAGAGKRGKEVRDAFEASPYGWPRDAVDAALITLHTCGHLRATHKGMTLSQGQLDQAKISLTDFRSETATLNAREKMKLRKLFQDTGVDCKPSEETAKAPVFLTRLADLAERAGGEPPSPARPSTVHLDTLRSFGGVEQLAEILKQHDTLAAYMETSKDGERAELWELRGFAATTIKDAFRCVDVMAGATKAEQPFFHVQVRNREGEIMTRQQFEYAADRIERMLGLTGQPRAITFHTYEHNNDQHMHVAWSRIDQDTMKAKPVPFFKLRLKNISRELELHFGLEPVTNHRESKIKYAPTKAQEEQARRLGLDIHKVQNAIRDLWDRSDNGRSFQAALEHEGFILAKGERRDFVVIDQAGGMHPLGKRILDMTASKVRDRLSDLSRDDLPSVVYAQTFVREQGRQEKKERKQAKPEPTWDRERDDRKWQDAVINAAIEHEKTERKFVEPEPERRQGRAGSRKKEWTVAPPTPEPIRTSPEYHFEDAARVVGRNQSYSPPKELTGMSDRIMTYLQALWNDPVQIEAKGKTLSAVLDHEGIALARVTKAEADRSHREAEFAKAVGNRAPRYGEGEIVAVKEPTLEYRRNGQVVGPAPRIHKLDQKAAETFVAALDKPRRLQGIDATLQALNDRAQQRAEHRNAIRFKKATNIKNRATTFAGKNAKRTLSVADTAARTIGKTLDAASDAFTSLFAPTMTPQQIRDGERIREKREVEAEDVIDFTRYTAELAQQRQQEQEREAVRRREQHGRER